MLIDWFTVAAQGLNFLILVWLMRRFLYHPILLAIDKREKRNAADLAEAKSQRAEAQKQSDLYRGKMEAFDKQRAILLQKATDEAEIERQRLLEEARKEADAQGAKRRAALADEANALAQSIARRTGEEVFAIARKTLADLASASLEERVVAVFLERLRQMNGKTKDDLSDALKTAADPVLLRSAFALPAPQRLLIEAALYDIFAKKIELRYEVAPELVSGIDLSANGRRVGWDIGGYLDTLQKTQPAGVSP